MLVTVRCPLVLAIACLAVGGCGVMEREDPAPHFDVTAAEATVVDDDFDVEDQHNWIYFPLSLPAGSHEVVAKSDSGERCVSRSGCRATRRVTRSSSTAPRMTRSPTTHRWTSPGSSCAKRLHSAERAGGATGRTARCMPNW